MDTGLEGQLGLALYDVLCLGALGGALGNAYATSVRAGDPALVVWGSVAIGLVAGVATYVALTRAGDRLVKAAPAPSELRFFLLYVATFVGILAASSVASWAARVTLRHAVA